MKFCRTCRDLHPTYTYHGVTLVVCPAVETDTLHAVAETPPTRKDLIDELKLLAKSCDKEAAHGRADDILLELINDPIVTQAFKDANYWYA